MAIKVVLNNSSQQTSGFGIVGQDTGFRMDREIYQDLMSLAKNKNILADYEAGKLSKRSVELYEQFDRIYRGLDVDNAISEIDNYLGALGISENYFYSKDCVDIPAWFSYTDQAPTRNVINQTGNIIDRNTGYNVIHNTNRETEIMIWQK